ncbi:DUF6907 domain-containing protein [Streptomyces pacificus]|uniref:Uncharacterized protein n=1 Tax=Streptomyces pacificus TaxID=2705029 RepID=A0A6A0B3F4_9ACTN|nr:hypothetical protein [Streptomyces pacificus]GFH38874.1 hypothetical protein SCWH03_51370 [Streptomyces pacificus]
MSILAQTAMAPSTPVGQSGEPAALAETVLLALAAAGADETTLDTTREILATGQVYRTFATAVHDQNNRDLLPVVDMLDEIIGRVADQRPLKPLVDMIKREQAKEQQAEPGHHPWCKTGACITRHYDDGQPCTEHVGPRIDMPIPKDMGCASNQLLSADLHALEEFSGGPQVSFNSGGNGVLLGGPELDEVIDDLDTFVDGLRHLRRLMGQEKAQ